MSDDFDKGAIAMIRWIYSNSGKDFAELLFPDSHPHYQQEKACRYTVSAARTILLLDDDRQRKLFDAVRKAAQP